MLTTICGNRHPVLEYAGPNLLIVFSSGVQVPPYNYNGFVATLEFLDKNISTESNTSTAIQNYFSTTSEEPNFENIGKAFQLFKTQI